MKTPGQIKEEKRKLAREKKRNLRKYNRAWSDEERDIHLPIWNQYGAMIDQLGEKLGLEYNDFDIVQMFVEEFAFDAPTQEASRSYYFKHGMGEDEEERRDNAEFYGPIWDRLEEIGVEELQIIVDFVKDQAIKGIDLKQR